MLLGAAMFGTAVCAAFGAHNHRSTHQVVFDLSYHYDNATPHWPTAMGFEFKNMIARGDDSSNWYAMNDFCVGEHAGTHLDAPYHFSRDGMKVADIPLSKLINKGYVLDFEALGDGETTPNTTLQPRHIQQFEKKLFGEGGRLPRDAILLIRFNWGRYYGSDEYLNNVETGTDELNVSFPGIGPETARLLVERGIAGFGVDTASVDPGYSKTFDVHRILATANIFGLENVNIPSDLARHNGRFAVYALPMKIREGTGAPCRVLAVVQANE